MLNLSLLDNEVIGSLYLLRYTPANCSDGRVAPNAVGRTAASIGRLGAIGWIELFIYVGGNI